MSRFGSSVLFAATLVISGVAVPAEAGADNSETAATGIAVHGGLGLPELLHAEVGYFATPRLLVEVQYKNVIFNHLVGVGVSGYLLGTARERRPGPHSLVLSGSALINPGLGSIRFDSGGDVIAATLAGYAGWSWSSRGGFSVRILGGAFLYADDGLAGGPSLHLGAGYVF